MSARGIIGGIAGVAKSALTHPRTTTEQAIGVAKQLATTGTMVAERLARRGKRVVTSASGSPATAAHPAAETEKPAAKKPAAKKTATKKPAAKKTAAKKREPEVVLAVDLATPPQEPPVDVVGQALAKEAEDEATHAPSGSTLPPAREQDEAGVDPATLKAVRAEAEMMTKAASHKKS